MKKLLTIALIGLISCKTTSKFYVQDLVKTPTGFKKVGQPYEHTVNEGDTVKAMFKRK